MIIDQMIKLNPTTAIIAMYGSRARGDFAPTSDVEFFSVVDKKNNKNVSFLFRDISVDAHNHEWERFEQEAARDAYWIVPAGTLALCKVVYSRSDKDLARFEQLREKVVQNHEDPNCFDLEKAEESYQGMLKSLGGLQLARFSNDLHEAHGRLWGIIIGYTIFVALVNGKHLLNNWGKNLDDIATYDQPQGCREIIEELVTATDLDRILELSTDLVDRTRRFLINFDSGPLEKQPDIEMLDNVNGIEYIYKMIKAIGLNHKPALGYAIIDSQPLFAKDLIVMNHDWRKFSQLLQYDEYASRYKAEFPDLLDLLLHGTEEELLEAIEETLQKVTVIVQDTANIPNFEELDEVQGYFDSQMKD